MILASARTFEEALSTVLASTVGWRTEAENSLAEVASLAVAERRLMRLKYTYGIKPNASMDDDRGKPPPCLSHSLSISVSLRYPSSLSHSLSLSLCFIALFYYSLHRKGYIIRSNGGRETETYLELPVFVGKTKIRDLRHPEISSDSKPRRRVGGARCHDAADRFPGMGPLSVFPLLWHGGNFSLSLTHSLSLSLSPYFRHKRGFSFCTVTEYKRGQLRYFFCRVIWLFRIWITLAMLTRVISFKKQIWGFLEMTH